MPHFLALNEKRVPMEVVRVNAEDPVVSLRGRNRHRGFESASNIHAAGQKAKQNMRVSRTPRSGIACCLAQKALLTPGQSLMPLVFYKIHAHAAPPISTNTSSPRT